MTTTWPHESPYAEAAVRLRDAIDIAVMQDAVAKAVADLDYLVVCLYDNPRQAGRAQNIRDDLAALIDESERP